MSFQARTLLAAVVLSTVSMTSSFAQNCPLSRRAPQVRYQHVVRTAPVYRQVVPPPPARVVPETKVQRARRLVTSAKQAFAAHDYVRAEQLMDRVVELTPEQADAYQFRAMALFAQQDFDAAAADVFDVLLRGPMWTWATVHSLYKSTPTYTNHYGTLANAAQQDQKSLAKHFLLAYHHIVLGHLDLGEKELIHVLKIKPDETVSQKLLQVVRAKQISGQKLAQR